MFGLHLTTALQLALRVGLVLRQQNSKVVRNSTSWQGGNQWELTRTGA